MTKRTDTGSRFEGLVLVVILLSVAGMAGAASFRHVHDWTMHNSPTGTADWFGWANAMVSELIPLAASLELRRRHRLGLPGGRYPIALIVAAVALSLAGQLAEAKPGLSGWLISAVPALGFLALVKLVLSRPTPPTADVDEATSTSGATSVDVDSLAGEPLAPVAPAAPPSPAPVVYAPVSTPAAGGAIASRVLPPLGVVQPSRINGAEVMPQ